MCNNPAVAGDGTIYFSTSSTRNAMSAATRDVVEGVPTGRLFRLLPDGRVEKLCDGLYFANGVVLAPDESFVLVAETGRARISRLWLTGDKAGKTDVFTDNLRGLPDNINVGSDGLIWVAMVVPKPKGIERLWSAPFWLRWSIARLPASMQPRTERVILLAAIRFDGTVVHHIRVENGPYHFVTSARELDGQLYLGSIEESTIARLTLPSGRE